MKIYANGESLPLTTGALIGVRDISTQEISPAISSLVYKNKVVNNAPAAFGLVSPGNATDQKTVLVFDWENTSDADVGTITYNLIIASNSDFSNIVYRKEDITTSMTYIDDTAGLYDNKTYYWKVEAVDGWTRTTSSDIRSFNTKNDTNFIPGFIVGVVYSNADYSAIVGAGLSTDLGAAAISIEGGAYIMVIPPGTVALVSSYTGYDNAAVVGISVRSGGTTVVNVPMEVHSIPTLGFVGTVLSALLLMGAGLRRLRRNRRQRTESR